VCCTIPLLTPKLAKPEPNRDHDGRLGALGVGQVEDRKSLGQVLLGPQGEFGGLGLPSLERLAQESFGLGLVRRVEDGADAQGDGLALIQAGDVSLGILLQVELAVLPGHAGQGRPAGGLEAGMVVGDDQADALQAAPDQAVEEGTPMSASDRATETPSTRRLPSPVTPTATSTAQSTSCPLRAPGLEAWRPAGLQAPERPPDTGLIRSLHAELKGAYGSPRMVRELRARGFSASKERVQRLMGDNGMPFRTSSRHSA